MAFDVERYRGLAMVVRAGAEGGETHLLWGGSPSTLCALPLGCMRRATDEQMRDSKLCRRCLMEMECASAAVDLIIQLSRVRHAAKRES